MYRLFEGKKTLGMEIMWMKSLKCPQHINDQFIITKKKWYYNNHL